MKILWLAAAAVVPLSQVSLAKRAGSHTATISHPQATIIGDEKLGVEVLPSIPFAKPPVGPLHLKSPQLIAELLGNMKLKE
ncbi:hypothetical protein PAAG_08098 [Paracoccidioides lutzii Pb01]|uniref:Uncharacterized protein n=1 Tax=Paracoccidioides lutzii (strain ATCC MYA-826 / Pb01) TaxID=502779 RepID=C1HBF7_PARBA|nr:hypothetical protein PAAG_08098 [Paracoccidioides lutzii Pb01]EEH37680.2 hypothetical protein PAAG_08098 [Paracoccidioides lutzii Pb01]